MRAISLWQPWATLLARGMKQHETRSWSTAHRGWIAIHAATKWNAKLAEIAASPIFDEALVISPTIEENPRTLHRGAIIGAARLDSVLLIDERIRREVKRENPRNFAFGDWTPGRYAWDMVDAVEIPPIACTGRQGIFKLEPRCAMAVGDAVRRAVEARKPKRMRF